MKKLSALTCTLSVLILVLVLASAQAIAAPNEHLDWGAQLHSGASSCPSGTLVINVVHKVTSDDDSGFGGYWATDEYVRKINVVRTADGTYCATVSYQGSFTSYAGTSPSGTSVVGADVVGTFEGGYVSTLFTGVLKDPPDFRAKGSIGTFDYGCDGSGNCSTLFSWRDAYFTSTAGFDFSWWGWIYHGGSNGTWVNQIGGSSGDITGN
jgi:hypothetical protein